MNDRIRRAGRAIHPAYCIGQALLAGFAWNQQPRHTPVFFEIYCNGKGKALQI